MKPSEEESFYGSIELSEEELKEAILEGRKKKYFKEKHKGHWPDDEEQRRAELITHLANQIGTGESCDG